jgi:hypothetical protein
MENDMLLADFLKAHGIELDQVPENPPKLSSGVRFLLFLLSRRHVRGKVVSVDSTLLKSEWPASITESFEQSLQDAITVGHIKSSSDGYYLTESGKNAAH